MDKQQALLFLDSLREKEKSLINRELAVAEREAAVAALKQVTLADAERAQQVIAKDKTDLAEKKRLLDEREALFISNISALPYMAGIIADYDTRGLDLLADQLDWGRNIERKKKVASIRELKRQTKLLIEEYKIAQYRLDYALKMFPALADFLETDYSQLHSVDFSKLPVENHDNVRAFLSEEEYVKLSTAQRNQLALDRYLTSHRRTNWQIGRDYENYVGYVYTHRGYSVEYYGSLHGLEDLGRDLIAVRSGHPTLIIQCKYWSSKKTIHEKHINQLYGTLMCYCFENNLPFEQVKGILVTNISISETARKFAKYLSIEVVEQFPLKQYPCIKCNINKDEYGKQTKIYHLPFDQQYDSCKIDRPGEFFAMTVAEAEAAGFRRAFKWYGE